MMISVSIPYTCGELFQGTLDGQPCLVSCPITIYSTAQIVPGQTQHPLPHKARRALENLLVANIPAEVSGMFADVSDLEDVLPSISLIQRLPNGRGYGTSTADIGAVLFAASSFAGFSLDPLQAAHLAVAIEPTDSTFFPGLVLFDHRQGKFYEILGAAPPVMMVILDPGGRVDSEAFNACNWQPALTKLTQRHRQAFELMQQAIVVQDVSALGEAATLSAKAHQEILFNPWLDQVLALAKSTGAAGICRAHSGTILGLLFSKPSFDEGSIIQYLRKQLPAQIYLRVTELTGGGPV